MHNSVQYQYPMISMTNDLYRVVNVKQMEN